MTEINNNKNVIVKPEDVRRAREALMEQGIPLEVTYMNHAYETLRWELAPVLATYSATETERLQAHNVELKLHEDLALCEVGDWMKRAEAAESERDRLHLIAESYASTIGALGLNMQSLVAERDRLRKALEKIDAIRNNIVGRQTVNWSAHIYPLVAALKEAGFDGLSFEEARAALQGVVYD